MSSSEKAVSTVDALVAATTDKSIQRIAVSGHLADVPSLRLSSGQSLRGVDEDSAVAFAAGIDGLQLSSDNRIHNMRLNASVDKRAIFNDTSVDSLGRIELRSVTTTGRVQILARDKVCGGHVDVASISSQRTRARRPSVRTATESTSSTAHLLFGICSLTRMWSSAPT